MSENNDQRTTHVGGNSTEAIIVSGNGNVINMPPQNTHAATPSFFDSTQEDKIADLCEFYLERPEILAEIDKQLNLNARCLLICGEPGIGKSALSAFLIRKFQKDAQYHVIYHLIGYSWKNWKKIVMSLLYQLRMKFENLNLTIPNEESEDDTLISLYREALSRISKILEDKKLVIVIDALDELEIHGESLKTKNLFQFIPSDLLWKNICFLLTSRFGDIRRRFTDYMRGKPISFELKGLNEIEFEKIINNYGVSLDAEKAEKLFNKSEKNLVYGFEILKKISDNRDYDWSELPDTVVGFFRKELIEKFDITENELLKSILALIKVFQIHPSDWHFRKILGLENEKQISSLLASISHYLTVSKRKESSPLYPKLAGKNYSFFHSSFAESLTFGNDPLITDEDIIEAHRKIINWCEPFDRSEKDTPRFHYGEAYLPYHYWMLRKYDDYKGFIDFLNQGTLSYKSCKDFLKRIFSLYNSESFIEIFGELFSKMDDRTKISFTYFFFGDTTKKADSVSHSKQIRYFFICYANEDKDNAIEINNKLIAKGFKGWIAEKDIIPGEEWELSIRKALKDADKVIICLSEKSINKRGYVQKEITMALNIIDEIPENKIFVIPVLLEDCMIPERLKRFQAAKLFQADGFDKLIKALEN